MLDEAADYIEKLEAVIDGIEGGLCDYCNQVGDPFEPVSKWDDYCERSFQNLCKVYNDWYKRDKNIIGDITMRDYRERKELRERVAELEKELETANTLLSVSTEDW
jgi:hypothetical protein